ncbi:GGDEF domain-containing protein [Rhizobium sp. C4]|uniref:GGDEF domain-containing protein n=1 Tax=Rhizobium sp. C4 TaxID=1349800 RepID=UPI001E525D07|nr:diguanylate cyclase [Rhizobium sp. C4]MCD2173166.1 GGDEF domain-containing protein [Rhizobium sp. C4]
MHAETQTTLSEIEDTLSRKGWRGVFPPHLEQTYQRDMGKVRERAVRRALLPTLVIYNLLLVTDIALLPQTAKVAALLHFAVVTPGLLLLYFLYFRLEGYLQRQVAEAAIPVLICAQTLTVMALNTAPNAGYYQYFIPLILLFSNVNQRLDTRVAGATSLVILLMYLGVLIFQNMLPEQKLAGLSFIVVSSYLGHAANLRAQRDSRYGFLMRLRENVRLRAAETDAMLDQMTGLGNRRYLANFVSRLPQADGEGCPVSAILMDIDFFKAYNDLYGHGRGDDCIKTVAEVIDGTSRLFSGTAVRYGGEEFLIVLPETDKAAAIACAEAIRVAVEDLSIEHGSSQISPFVTVSLGVASGTVNTETFQLLIASADASLYAAKAGGRNRFMALDGEAPAGAQRVTPAIALAKRVLH